MVRRFTFGGLIIGIVALVATPAWAHVTISPDSADKGGADQEIGFRVPNEETSATTTKIQIQIPTDHPLLGVLAQAVPGWTAKVTTVKLKTPIHTDDGDISDAVSEVDWTATSNATGIAPNDYQRFEIIVGQLPDANSITFPAIQTYSNGDVVRWIQLETPGGPAPDKPAPVLTLTKAGATATPTTQPAGAPTATATVKKSDVDSAKTLGIVGIIVGALGLLVAGAALAIRRKAQS